MTALTVLEVRIATSTANFTAKVGSLAMPTPGRLQAHTPPTVVPQVLFRELDSKQQLHTLLR